ncbi:MAG: F0F1 ATP synthase subunit alpha, partial [Polyangiales bacterium]
QYVPMDVVEQVVVIYAANNGYVDKYELRVLRRYEQELLEYLKASHKDLLDSVRAKQKLDEDNEPKLKAALKAFGEVFDTEKK